MHTNIAIIVPALNEEKTIGTVIDGVKHAGQVIVVNDGSNDNTAQVSAEHGAMVVSHLVNKGYDMALYSGFKKSLEIKASIVLSIDADGQHNPEDIQKFIDILERNEADIVLGYRPKAARISERIFRIWAKYFYGIEDILCGLKAYNTSALLPFIEFVKLETVGTAAAIKIVQNNGRLKQLPIEVNDREDIPRLGRALRANWIIFKAMLRSAAL